MNNHKVRVIHPGNRGEHWCDIESSRNFVYYDDENINTIKNFDEYIDQLLKFPIDFFYDKKLIIKEKFYIFNKNGIEICIFSELPGWLAVSNSFELIMKQIVKGTTTTKIESNFSFEKNQLHLLLVTLYIKGVLLVEDKLFNKDFSYPILYQADDLALVEITKQCNLRCSHCFNSSGIKLKNELNFNEIKMMIDKIEKCNSPLKSNKNIVFSGGEPLCRKDILDIIEYANIKGYRVEILTNGLLINDKLIKSFQNYEVQIRVSLDGCTKESHEKIRGQNTFDKTVKTIKKLLSFGIKTGITTVISKYNYLELDKIVSFLKILKVDFFTFIVVNELGKAIDSKLINYKISKIYSDLFFLAETNEDFYSMMSNSTLANIIACNIVGLYFDSCGLGKHKDFYIQSNGDIFPCRATILEEFKLGNIKFDDISTSSFSTSIELLELNNLNVNNLNYKCSNCKVRYWCGGDCRGEVYQTIGDIKSPTNHCKRIIEGIEASLYLCAKNPKMYFEKSEIFYKITQRIDSITKALIDVNRNEV